MFFFSPPLIFYQFDNIQKYNDFWIFTNELSGNNGLFNGENNISINSNCINNIFQCSIQSKLKDFIINKSFTDNFKNNILKLIDHCFNLKRTYLTSSDVDFIVDQKTINSLQNEKETENFLTFVYTL